MSEHDDVTVVIPCMNYGRFLAEALDSVRGQEGGSPRILVIDDGSTEPETRERLADLAHDVELLRQANARLSAARNAAYRAAGSPLLITLCADDMPSALRTLKRGMAADPDAGFAYGVTRFFGDWSGDMTIPGWEPYRLPYRHTIGPTALTPMRAEARLPWAIRKTEVIAKSTVPVETVEPAGPDRRGPAQLVVGEPPAAAT